MKETLDLQRVQIAWTRYVAGPEPVPEQLAGVRVSIITVGPDREQTIDRYWH